MQLVATATNSLLLALFVAGVSSLVVALWVPFRYDAVGVRVFGALYVTIGLWAFVGVVHVWFAANRLVVEVATGLELVGAALAGVLWFVFASKYTNRGYHREPAVQVVLVGFVTLIAVLALTAQGRELLYPSYTLVETPVPHLVPQKGPGHFLATVGGYVTYVVGIYLVLAVLRESQAVTRAIALLLVSVTALPLANLLPYLVELPIEHNPLFMPVGGAVASLFVVGAIHENLFTVTPVARRTVFTAIRDPIVTLDRAEHVVDTNVAFREEFGVEAVEHPSRLSEIAPAVAEQLAIDGEGTDQQVTLDGVGRDNEQYYTVSVSPLWSGPHLLGHTLVFNNVTALTQSRRELIRQNDQLDAFSVAAAHHLRNPLTIVSGFTDILDNHLLAVGENDARFEPTVARESIATVRTQTERMDEIITDFLRVMRQGKSLTSVQEVPFADALLQAREKLTGDDELTLRIERSGTIHAAPDRLVVLLTVVLRSALDRSDGPVTVTTTLEDGGISFVDDAGEISVQECEMLLEHGTTANSELTGLGFTVVRTLADVHGWTVTLEPADGGLAVRLSGVTTTLDVVDETG